MVVTFERNLITRVFNTSVDYGVCARCGRPVVYKNEPIKGKLYKTEDMVFYECSVCVEMPYDKFFFNKWYNMYLVR